MVQSEQGPRDRSANHPGNGVGCHKPGEGSCPCCFWKPVLQIQNNAWEESSLSGAQHETQLVETRRGANGYHAAGNDSPQHHDRGHPTSSSYSCQCQIAGQLKKEVTGKEDSEGDAENALAECQLVLHLQLREADVDSVKVIDDVEKEKKRQQTPKQLADNA